MSGEPGFALPEYVTPKSGLDSIVPGGTMTKSSRAAGGILSEVQRQAGRVGPDHYDQNLLDRSFNNKAKGGNFSKLVRSYGKNSAKTPPVGLYDTFIEPKIKGGIMSKTERGCYIWDQATRQNRTKQPPGKYDGSPFRPHVRVPSFQQTRTESRNPKKTSNLGPGCYEVRHDLHAESIPSYTCAKEGAAKASSRSFMDAQLKHKLMIPSPGHRGIPDSKVLDRQGIKKHVGHLLRDRPPSNMPTPR